MLSLIYPEVDTSTITNEKLRIIAKDLRVFSFLSNREEKKKYQDKTIEREQWVKYLNKPPITTACILRCIIQPDAAKINGPGSYMKKLLLGTTQSGCATDYICHAHSYSFHNLVDAIQLEAEEYTKVEYKVYKSQAEQRRKEREKRDAAKKAAKGKKTSARKKVITRQNNVYKRYGVDKISAAAHQESSRYGAGFGHSKKRICTPKLQRIRGGDGGKKKMKRPNTAARGREKKSNSSKNRRPKTAQIFTDKGRRTSNNNQRPSTAPLKGSTTSRRSIQQTIPLISPVRSQRVASLQQPDRPMSGHTHFLPQTASPLRLAPPTNSKVNLESLWHAIHVPTIASTQLPFDPSEAFDDDLHELHPLSLIKAGFKIKHQDLDKIPRGRFNIMLRWAKAQSWSLSPFAALEAERKRKERKAEEKLKREQEKNQRKAALQKRKNSSSLKRFNTIISGLRGASGPIDMRVRRKSVTKELMARPQPKKTRQLQYDIYDDDSSTKDDDIDLPFLPKNRFYWIDIFTLDYNAQLNSNQLSSYYRNETTKIIQSVGRTILIVEPLIAPIPFRRARCIWEIYLTINSGIELVVSFPQEEHDRFQRKIIKKFNKLVDIFCGLKAESSSDYKRSIQNTLHQLMEIDEISNINQVCRNGLTMFLLSKARETLDTMISNEQPLTSEAVMLCNQFGFLLMHEKEEQDLDEAEVLLKRGLKDAEEVNGTSIRPADIVQIRTHLAMLLQMRGKFDEALIKLERNLEASKRVFGDGSTEALKASNSYASLLTRMGQSKQAELLYRNSMTAGERAHHESYGCSDNMIHMFCDDSVRTMMDDPTNSPLHERVHSASTPLLGKVNPTMLRNTNHLALLVEADADMNIPSVGHLEEEGFVPAIKLYRRILAGYTKSFGVNHPSTFLALYNLSHALYLKYEHDQRNDTGHNTEKSANNALLIEAESAARLSLEGYTQFNLISDIRDGVALLGKILKVMDREEEAKEIADKAGFVFFCGRLLMKEQ